MSNSSEVAEGAGRSSELAPGAIVARKYRVLRAIGSGGMGAVFEAENTVTLKRLAVKWLHPRCGTRDASSKRLQREAVATSRVRHRNVVDLYDVVLDGDNVVLIMELLVGQPLSVHLRTSTLSFAAFLRLLLPAMEGVSAAHIVGVVHRDIKPENIFLVKGHDAHSWVPKVIDFGISQASGADLERLTQSGVAVGTPRYVSFEQLRGERDVDGRADVYAFGVMLYEALVGRPPYDGRSLGEQAVLFITTDPATPKQLRPEVPEGLSALVYAAIARDREQRVASLQELVLALRPYADEAMYTSPLPLWRGPALLPEGAAAAHACTKPETPTPHVVNEIVMNELATPKRSRLRPAFAAGAISFALLGALASWTSLSRSLREPTESAPSLRDQRAALPKTMSTPEQSFAVAKPLQAVTAGKEARVASPRPAQQTVAPDASAQANSPSAKKRKTTQRRVEPPVSYHVTPAETASPPSAVDSLPAQAPTRIEARGPSAGEPAEDGVHRAGSVSVQQF